jgi:hypothetical protein
MMRFVSLMSFKAGRHSRSASKAMSPQSINAEPSFGPEVLKVLSQAFDEVWEAIAGNFASTECDRPAKRLPSR